MEAPFLPPVSAGLFWCLVFAVCTRRASSCRASQVFGIEDQLGRPACRAVGEGSILKVKAPRGDSGACTLARIMAQHLNISLGHPVVIENVTGAAGAIAVGRVARAAPDGYTVSETGAPTSSMVPLWRYRTTR